MNVCRCVGSCVNCALCGAHRPCMMLHELLDADVERASEGRVPAQPSPPPERRPPARHQGACDSLKRCTLSYLRLERMNLGDEGTMMLAAELAKGAGESSLRALYLGNNNISDEGAMAIAHGIQGRPKCKLQRLYLQENPGITFNGFSLLQAVCRARGVQLIMEPRERAVQAPRPPSPPRSPSPRIATPPAPATPPDAPTQSPPPAKTIELLPCNKRRGLQTDAPPGRAAAVNADSGSNARQRAQGPAAGRRPTSSPTSTRAMRWPPMHPADEPRYRATRPRGDAVERYDLMPCSRVRLPTGRTGMAYSATRSLDQRLADIDRASQLARLRSRAHGAAATAAEGGTRVSR